MPIQSFEKDTNKYRTVELDKDENGRPYLTERYIRELCEINGQFETPYLNDTLYLHFKGFQKV